MPHQRHVMDVSQELDEHGHRWYRTVIWELMRQNGKSTSVDALLVRGTARAPDITSVYGAQNRLMARRRLLDDLEKKRLRRSPATRGRYRPNRSNGSEAIEWHNGSYIYVIANTDDAGHGLTLNGEAVVDEAFAHRDLTVTGALSPTMITCPDAQLWIISTPGDGKDGLLQHYEDVGSAAIHDPDARVAYFKYGRAEDEDPLDEEVWRRRIPALGTPEQVAAGERTITIEGLRSELRTLGPVEFDRAYLCHRRTESHTTKIDPVVWASALDPDAVPSTPLVLAAEIAHDRSAASIAALGPTGDGRLVGVIDRRPGVSWLAPTLRDLQRARRPAAIAGDDRGPIGSMLSRLELDVGPIDRPSTVEFSQSAGDLVDALAAGELVHVGQVDLDTAAAQARHRPLGDLWAWDRRRTLEEAGVDVSPLAALTLALWCYRSKFPGALGGRIHR